MKEYKPIIKHFDTEEEWLEFKDTITVSASTIGSIEGLNDYETPFTEWERKTGRTPKLISTIPMKIGAYGEYAVAMRIFKDDYDVEYLRDRSKILMYQHPVHEFIAISPDDVCVFDNDEMLMEVKITSAFFDEADIPDYYKSQVNFQMGVSGYKRCLFLWLNLFKKDYAFTIMDFDEDKYELQIEAAIQFNDCVVTDTPPPMIKKSDFDTLNVTEGKIEADDEATQLFFDMCETNDRLKEVKAHMEYLKDKVAKYMNDQSLLTRDGVKLITYKSQDSRRVDTKLLKADDVYDKYAKITTSRKMDIKYGNLEKL